MNDPDTLSSILAWGETCELTPGRGEFEYKGKDNPILIACQQDFRTCMEILFSYGYRMEEYESNIDEDNEEQDQVREYLKFQTCSNIHYLSLEFTHHEALLRNARAAQLSPKELQSLERKDPIRKAFSLMERAKDYKHGFQGSNELKLNYVSIFDNLEAFIEGILTQCKGIDEVRTLLDYNADDDDDDELDDAEANWHIALNCRYKGIVSHPNFQQYFWNKLSGDGKLETHIPHGRTIDKLKIPTAIRIKMRIVSFDMKNIPLTLLTFFCCYIPVVFIDLFKNADILFVKPKALQRRLRTNISTIELLQTEEDLEKRGCLNFFRTRMHIPLFRMVPYFFIQLVYLALLCYSVWNPNDPLETNFKDYTSTLVHGGIAWFALNFLLEDIIDMNQPYQTRSFWRTFSFITHLLLVGGFIVACLSSHVFYNGKHQANLSGNNPVNIGWTMFSIALGLEVFRTLQWLVLLEATGPIALCVIEVMKDATRMISVCIIIVIAHAFTFHSMFKPFFPHSNGSANYTPANNSFQSTRSLVMNLVWRFITTAGPEDAEIKKKGHDSFSLEFSHLIGLLLWFIFQLIVAVLLINLLIAVMNNSYSNLWQNARKESKFSKSYFQV